METLLLEDDLGDVALLQAALNEVNDQMDNHITHVERLKQALEKLSIKRFDVALVDLSVPDSHGMNTVKTLIAEAPSLPVVVLTGNADESLGIEAVNLGAQDFLTKNQLDGTMLSRTLRYAIERKKMVERLKESKDQLHIEKVKLEEILDIEQGLNGIVHLDKLINFVVKKTSEVLNANKCSLIFINEATKELVIKGSIGLEQQVVNNNTLNMQDSITGLVVEEGLPVLVADIETDLRFLRKNRRSYSGKSFMSVPIKLGDDILGVLNVADNNLEEVNVFTKVDLKVLIMIARQVAVAMENAKLYKELNYLTITDPLTDMYNFRHFSKTLDQEIHRLRRHGRPLCLLLIDVDDFKTYNDTYGHLSGDALLQNLSRVFKENTRQIDIACRYAGDEFVVILPETNVAQAKIVAQKIKRKVEELKLKRKVTLSIGIAGCTKEMDRHALVQKADEALYEAKKIGKNRVHASEN